MGPVLPVGARLTRRVREEPPPGELARVYSDRDATMSGAQRCGSAGVDRRPNAAWVSLPAVWPGWIAGRTPRGFHCRLSGRDGSPAEPPPGELGRVGFTAGCLAGMDRRPNAAWVSLPAVWPGWIAGRTPRGFHSLPAVWPGWIAGRAPTGRTGPRGFHYRLFGGMDRRSNAAWVSPQAVNSRWWNPGERRESGEAPGWQGA